MLLGFVFESSETCGSTTMVGFTNNRSSNQTTAPFFGQTSTGLGTTPANLFSTSQNTGPITWGQNKGSRIKSYECTTIRDGEQSVKHMSISAMSTYASKSHEELRWEDYELQSGGQQNPVNNQIQELSTQPLNVTLSATPKPLFSVPLTNVDISSPNPLPNFPIVETKKSLFNVSNSVRPQDPISPLALSLQNPQLPTQSSGPALSFPAQSPSVGSGCVQVNPTISLLPWNNASMPLDFPQPQPQPSVSPLQCSVTGKVTESIIAVKDPFGSKPVTSQPSISHSACVSLVQHGISSMPVFKEPTNARPSRVSSLLMSRYHPVRPLAVNVRRYHPSSDGPKVPFFDKGEEALYTNKAYSCVVPRENPRSVFAAASTELTNDSIHEVPTMKHATVVECEDGSENAKEDQINSSTPNRLKDHLTEANGNEKETYKLVMPKLQHPDYYTEPRIEKIALIESNNPGFCCQVKDFVVGRKGYGWVKFYGETDVRGFNLDSLIQFNDRELLVYEDCEKPPIGQGLNKAAEVTLLNVRCMDKTGKQFNSGKMVDKFREKLKKLAEKQGAEFASYDPVEGVWKFIVQHF